MSNPARPSLALVVAGTRREVSDAELARALVEKDTWAAAEAWHRFAPMVLTTAERALGSKSDAEDLAQEVFVRVLRNVMTLRHPASLRSFVYSITIRTLKSELRYRRVKAWLSFGPTETLAELDHSTPDLEARELLQKFYAMLDRLSARDRLAFVLRRVECMTVEEIAAAMELSPSTVKRSLAHASARLARWIESAPAVAELLDGRLGGRGA
ncbi:MAG TPA: sigma-70 family RNA polymerase sigma factor [Polyangiaceae bacterium]|nr:sigma-70 family RNA polymerase sigma factor [Polyangiaceae bacterium]